MEVKPGYKQTEVGVIPEEWEANTIGGCCTCFSGGTPSTSNPSYYGGNIAWITSSDLNKERISEVDGRITEDGLTNSASKIVNKGTLLLALYGATAGVCAISEIQAAINQAVLAISPRRGDIEYLFQFLTFRKDHFIKTYTQGGQPNFSGEIVKSFYVPLPPLPEQRAIATALSDVDGLLGGLDRLIAKKRDLKQAAMQQLLTGQTRLPGFHAEWEVKRLGEICEIAMGRTPPRLNQAFWGHGYKWLSIADLQTKVVSDSKEEITALAASMMSIIPKGTLLMSFKLSLGRLCFAGCDLFTNEAICSFNKLQANAHFLYYALGRTDFSLYGKQAVKGYTLNKESLKSIEVTLPPLPEQTTIASVLTEMDAELALLTQRREKTRALKQAMMQELLTGKTRLI